jgi:hypothetical protein
VAGVDLPGQVILKLAITEAQTIRNIPSTSFKIPSLPDQDLKRRYSNVHLSGEISIYPKFKLRLIYNTLSAFAGISFYSRGFSPRAEITNIDRIRALTTSADQSRNCNSHETQRHTHLHLIEFRDENWQPDLTD